MSISHMNLNEIQLFSFLLQENTQSGLTTLRVMMAGLPQNELRWKLQMLLAIKENNPFEAFRVAGSHVFETKDDPIVLALLLGAAVLIEHNIPGLKLDLPSPSPKPVSPTLGPVFAVPAVRVAPKLTNFVKTVLRKHIIKNGKITGQEALGYAIKYGVQISDVKTYCDYSCEKLARNALKQLNQANNAKV